MQLNIPADVEALVQKQLATGAFADEADVIRRALETLEAEGTWSQEERRTLDNKIDGALEQVAAGKTWPEEARRKLAWRCEKRIWRKSGRLLKKYEPRMDTDEHGLKTHDLSVFIRVHR